MIGKSGPVSPKLFTYLRYDADLSKKGLKSMGLNNISPKKVQKLDSINSMQDLLKIGEKVGLKVQKKDFRNFL